MNIAKITSLDGIDVRNLSTEQVLGTIYAYEVLHEKDLQEVAEQLYRMVVISRNECRVLSFLFFTKGECCKYEDACWLLQMDNESVQEAVDGLENNNLAVSEDGITDVAEQIDLLAPVYGSAKEMLEAFQNKYSSYSREQLVDWMDAVAFMNPDIQFCKGYLQLSRDLSCQETIALLKLARSFIQSGVTPINNDNSDGMNGLVEKGLASVVAHEAADNEDESIPQLRISVGACKTLFAGMKAFINYVSLSKHGNLVKCSEISHKELYYNEKDRYNTENLFRMTDTSQYTLLIERLKAKGRRPAITCLLYGAPGTGKTELCKQAALRSGRDIFIVAAAKLYGRYWGQSEKNFTELFENFKYLAAISSDAPILLFNEADGLLAKRCNEDSAIARAENTVQNILLQAMEDFEGIFIATTNLADHLDPAFDRRFLFKIEFHLPDATTRQKIWKTHIPDLDNDLAQALAGRYSFSGGHIENVAIKRDTHESLYGEIPSAELMHTFCMEEQVIHNDGPTSLTAVRGFETYRKK